MKIVILIFEVHATGTYQIFKDFIRFQLTSLYIVLYYLLIHNM